MDYWAKGINLNHWNSVDGVQIKLLNANGRVGQRLIIYASNEAMVATTKQFMK